jgi:hypothetical protein
MRELQMYAKVKDYTHVRSLRFLNVCMLGRYVCIVGYYSSKSDALQNMNIFMPITFVMTHIILILVLDSPLK